LKIEEEEQGHFRDFFVLTRDYAWDSFYKSRVSAFTDKKLPLLYPIFAGEVTVEGL
jgi:hypothetical protein